MAENGNLSIKDDDDKPLLNLPWTGARFGKPKAPALVMARYVPPLASSGKTWRSPRKIALFEASAPTQLGKIERYSWVRGIETVSMDA